VLESKEHTFVLGFQIPSEIRGEYYCAYCNWVLALVDTSNDNVVPKAFNTFLLCGARRLVLMCVGELQASNTSSSLILLFLVNWSVACKESISNLREPLFAKKNGIPVCTKGASELYHFGLKNLACGAELTARQQEL